MQGDKFYKHDTVYFMMMISDDFSDAYRKMKEYVISNVNWACDRLDVLEYDYERTENYERKCEDVYFRINFAYILKHVEDTVCEIIAYDAEDEELFDENFS